jgi:hypothetical protein
MALEIINSDHPVPVQQSNGLLIGKPCSAAGMQRASRAEVAKYIHGKHPS